MAAYKVIAIISIILFLTSIFLGFIGFPLILKSLTQKKINLIPQTPTRGAWQAFPFPFEFSIHVFNVTNPLEVQNGGKPVLQDVGPFIFDEFKDKYDLEDNEDDDSVSFNMRNTFIFRPDKSGELTGEEYITMPHPLIQMMAISTKRNSAEMLEVVADGLKTVFNNASPFITVPFMDLFFRGIFIDCSHEQPTAKAICDQFASGNVNGAKKFNETHFTFSLMGESNHTNAGRFAVFRGQRNTKDIGKVLLVNGKTKMDIWSGEECNKFKGTDGTVFPPFMNPADGLWSYSPGLCRSMALQMRRSVHFNGLPAVRFIMDFGDIKNEKDNTCFCRSYPDDCPVKGTMDLSPCTKTPMIASMPHFLHGDDSLLKNVDGLHPHDGLHGTHVDFEIMSGTPLSVYKRIQYNLDVEPVTLVDGMENLQNLVMPMFWLDENLNLVPEVTAQLAKLYKILSINGIVKWMLLLASIIGISLAIFLYNKTKVQRLVQVVN